MENLKQNKELKALEHAKNVWGTYFDDIDEDCNASRGELSQNDFLAGYNQALEDYKINEMLDVLKRLIKLEDYINNGDNIDLIIKDTRQLTKEAT